MALELPPLHHRLADLQRRARERAATIPPGYMSGSDAIRRAGVPARHFIEACLAGRIRSGTFGADMRAFLAEDVEAWITGLEGGGG
jgi:hypothetical protein